MTVLSTVSLVVWGLSQRRVMHLAPERVLALQQRRLRRLLRKVVRRSPFYRQKFRGIDVSRCPLSELPTTNKVELMEHFDDVATDPQVRLEDVERFMSDVENCESPYLGRYPVCHTSGSSGRPLTVMHNPRTLEVLFALQLTRGNARPPGPVEAVRRLFHPGKLAVIGLRKGFYVSASVWNHVPEEVQHFFDLIRPTPTDPDLVEQLNAFRPTAITAYVSTLELLALQKDRLRLAPELQQVTSNSEVLSDRARAEFREAFGVPIIDNYAMAECPFLSNGCTGGPGVHVNADWAILEVVDEAGRPVPPGETGHKVLVTNLVNDVQPFIRYEIGDRVRWGVKPCGCRNRLPHLECVEGRTADFFWVGSPGAYRQLLSFVFKIALEELPEVREWQAVQQERNRVLVRLELSPGTSLERERALRVLRFQLGQMDLDEVVEVEVECVPRLGPDPATGKLRRIVSLVGPPIDLTDGFRGNQPARTAVPRPS